jgi:hypothetical protein
MSRRTRLAVAVATGVGAVAVALPMTATTFTAQGTAQKLPVQVWVSSDGQVCYSANPDGSNAHCTG